VDSAVTAWEDTVRAVDDLADRGQTTFTMSQLIAAARADGRGPTPAGANSA